VEKLSTLEKQLFGADFESVLRNLQTPSTASQVPPARRENAAGFTD
jgi:hypothetical protein